MQANPYAQARPADPVDAALSGGDDCVLAVITHIDGPSYRPLGAIMAIFADGQCVGTLSSGCIEKDIALHALEALEDGKPKTVRYGHGSPFMDIKLPCGGGLEVLLLPRPEQLVLGQIAQHRSVREPCTLSINMKTGQLACEKEGETGRQDDRFNIRFLPDIRFLIFGKGPEAGTFSRLVQSTGFPNLLLSPDHETLDLAASIGCDTQHLSAPGFPVDLEVDPYTAIILFFHDHDWEPPILAKALKQPAFYIGAQGSKLARETRDLALLEAGLEQEAINRLRGPIGLVPSVRDARTLAISVLAEVMAAAIECEILKS